MDPDPAGAEPGARRRLSRTVTGTRAEAREALQRLVVEAGCDLHGGSHATVAVLLAQTMATAQLAPTTRADWESPITHHILPGLGDTVDTGTAYRSHPPILPCQWDARSRRPPAPPSGSTGLLSSATELPQDHPCKPSAP